MLRHVGRNRKKVSAIAALCVSPDRREVRLYFQLLVDENFNSLAGLGFLRQLARHFHDPLLLVWDRARIHRDLRVAVFVEVRQWRQVYFPPYAPELNPVEYVWGYLKSNPLANLACPEVSYSPLPVAATRAPYSTNPARFAPSSDTALFLCAFARTLLTQVSIAQGGVRSSGATGGTSSGICGGLGNL